MVLPIQEAIELYRKSYNEEIRSYIEKKEYEIASLLLGNIIFGLQEKKEDLFLNIHCGMSYLASARLLEEKLRNSKDDEEIELTRKKFEAYQAQTKLPC